MAHILFALIIATTFTVFPGHVLGQTKNLTASEIIPRTEVFFAPARGTFIEGSTFEVPIFLNTKSRRVNAIELHISFDESKLSVVKSGGGTSIIGLWVEPPSYDNTRGTAKVIGTIPNGITSESGLMITLTFRTLATGNATVSISDQTQILLDDGFATPTIVDANRATYSIVPKPPEGVKIFSETHPFQERWYNNSNVLFSWEKDPGVTGFGFILDKKPTTVPDNAVTGTETSHSVEGLTDGLWYFHIKALKQGVWGVPSHYLVRIDTAPPARFTPHIDYLSASVISRFLVNFYTTDSLSGLDHYEVGVIDKKSGTTDSPLFVQTESPYQLPFDSSKSVRIVVRAFDKAGNIREGVTDARVPGLLSYLIAENLVVVLSVLTLGLVGLLIIHYLFGHHIVERIRRLREFLRREQQAEKKHKSVDIHH